MPTPRTITTFLFDGVPSGMRRITLSNRPILGLVVPRADISQPSEFKNILSGKSGVYFLVGENTYKGEILNIYIGQSIDLLERIKSHFKERESWTTAIFFFTKENSLDSTRINFLERELILRSKKVGRAEVHENRTTWNRENPDVSVVAEMEEYLADMEVLIAHLGYPVLTPLLRTDVPLEKLYFLSARWCQAVGVYTEEGFVVRAGSTWPREMTEHVVQRRFYAARNRPKLLDQGVIEEREESIVFLRDHPF